MLLLWWWSMIFGPKQLQYIYLHLFMSIPPPNSLYYRPRKNNAQFFLNFCCLPKWAPRNLHIPPLGSMISRGPCRYVRGPTASALFALWPRTVVHASGHVEVPWGGRFQIFLLRFGRKSGFMLYIVLMISHVVFARNWTDWCLEIYFCFVLSDLFHWIQGNVERNTWYTHIEKTHGVKDIWWFQFFPETFRNKVSDFKLSPKVWDIWASLGILVYH